MAGPGAGAGVSEQALLDYFDDLLGDETAALARRPAPARSAPPPFAEPHAFTLRLPLPEPVPETVVTISDPGQPAPTVEALAAEDPATTLPVTTPTTPTTATPEQPPQPAIPVTHADSVATAPDPVAEHDAGRQPQPWLANGRPEWAQRDFECLLFRVGGLALAAPLVELGTIHPLAQEAITPIFGQAPWFMGLLAVKRESVRVIDSARVVMPERYDAAMREDYRYVITLNGSDWGLAVDRVVNAVRLTPEQVRWRGARGQRPWLAGTVLEQMCALVDGAQLVALFEQQDRKRRAADRARRGDL